MMNQTKKIQENARNLWLASLGTVATVEEESSSLFGRLVDRGKDFENRTKKSIDQSVKSVNKNVDSTRKRLGERVDDTTASVLHAVGIPSRREIQTLTERVEELTGKIEEMKAADGKSTAKKSTSKSSSK